MAKFFLIPLVLFVTSCANSLHQTQHNKQKPALSATNKMYECIIAANGDTFKRLGCSTWR